MPSNHLILCRSRRTCAPLQGLQNYNSLLNNHWQENVGSHQKKIPHVQGQRRSKMVGGVNCVQNQTPFLPHLEGSNKPCVHQDLEAPQRWSQIVFECLLQRRGAAVACCRGRGSGCSRPGRGISPLGGSHHYPTIELPELTQDWGQTLREHKQNLCAPRPRRKGQ